MLTTNMNAFAQVACLLLFALLHRMTLSESMVGLNVGNTALRPVGKDNLQNNDLLEEKYSLAKFWHDLKAAILPYPPITTKRS